MPAPQRLLKPAIYVVIAAAALAVPLAVGWALLSSSEAPPHAGSARERAERSEHVRCAKVPGFTAARATRARVDDCHAAQAVQSLLLAAGADAANVTITHEEDATLLGPDKSTNVRAQVFLPERLRDHWNAAAAAGAVARATGTTVDRVVLVGADLEPLVDPAITMNQSQY